MFLCAVQRMFRIDQHLDDMSQIPNIVNQLLTALIDNILGILAQCGTSFLRRYDRKFGSPFVFSKVYQQFEFKKRTSQVVRHLEKSYAEN